MRDKSAPTGGRMHLFMFIIGRVREQSGARAIGTYCMEINRVHDKLAPTE